MPDEITTGQTSNEPAAAINPEAAVSDATAAPPVTTTPEPPAPDPIDISPDEFAAGVRQLEQAMATAWASRELTATQIIQNLPDQEAQKAELARLAQEKREWQTAQQLIPFQLNQRNQALQAIAKQTGVPVSLLAVAKDQNDVNTIIGTWQRAHPVRQAAPAPAAPAAQADPAPTGPAPKVDSGVNAGVGAGGNEVWRSMSAADKIAWALKS